MRFVVLATLVLLAGCGQPSGNQLANVADNDSAPAADAVAPLAAPPTREAALKLMHERHEGMERIGKANKALGRETKSASPDLGIVRAAAGEIAGLAPKVPGWFPPGTGPEVGKTHAKADIWQHPEDFAARISDFQKAAQRFQTIAQGQDAGAIQASFGELGKTCKGCHDSYRAKLK